MTQPATAESSERAIHSRASDMGGSGGAFATVPPDMTKIGVGPFDVTPPNRHMDE
jgi:hypothetical protein